MNTNVSNLLEKARENFEQDLQPYTEDRALFESELNKVLEAPVDIMPGQRMFTQVAKNLARIYLARVDDYFF